ncbi:hormogonium polysaccharide biosynthesis protein HpsA [Microcoleus sp. F4-D5]|uniref:hormogonium polysaccharide biosynthesis protein HpsA n=1 Tax=Microcoleus sp. F4-D5 TaxID=2818760 RepID=UPI002FD0B514
MFKSKLSKVIVLLLRRVLGVTRSGAKRLMRAMLRSLMAMGRRAKLPVAGFVLPTVTMVLLVVILLTVAITLRSFDRANTARNVRVNQQVLAAATPALDRAKAKIQFMLREDPQRPTATPSDDEMYRMMSASDSLKATPPKDIYTFGDETRLKLKYDLDRDGAINPDSALPDAEKDEQINTAWRYAVDTDNNGLFDTFTLYGIYFRSPERKTTSPDAGSFIRARQPLEARTPPMAGKISDLKCAAAAGTSASLVGDSGWYKSEGKLKKSFFVYTVNLPITKTGIAGLDTTKYEEFKGTPSFSALEYQQDQSRIPLSNNAVVYEDDLEMSAGVTFSINGRIFTNSNFLATTNATLSLLQVSSPNSCFYEQENSKIIVSGNIVNDGVITRSKTVGVDLFTQGGTPITETLSSSTSTDRLNVLYNNQAYSERLSTLVDSWIQQTTPTPPALDSYTYPIAADPVSVQQLTKGPDFVTSRRRALEGYFKARMRKVPFGDTTATPSSVIQGTGDTLGPATEWNLLKKTDTAIKGDLTGPPGIELVNLPATNPNPDPPTDEKFLGDRIQVGNNLPEQRWDGAKFIGLEPPQVVEGSSPTWDGGDTTKERTRTPRVTQLADVGSTDRAGFWELAAAQAPETPVDGIGGLRVVTGGGVYERVDSFLPPPGWDNPTTTAVEASPTYDDPATTGITETYPIVWPDTMPMSPVLGVQKVYNNGTADAVAPANGWATNPLPPTSAALPAGVSTIDPNTPKYAKGDLRMRATAVYHYADNPYDPTQPDPGQTPIACISSYYDPSTSSTARNLSGLPDDVSGEPALGTRDANIGSNNGVVYAPPLTTARPTSASNPSTTTGLLSGGDKPELETQANYVFPNGRFANEPLRKALLKSPASRTLADNAAIDATNCSLGILNPTSFPLGTLSVSIPPGAIKEVAFLNGRDIKAIDRNDSTTIVDETFTLSSPLTGNNKAQLSGNYDLALEERQPLEIRATVLDIDQLRKKPIAQNIATGPSPEYLLPNSGIIYATRDDALPDRSDRQETSTGSGVFDEDKSKTVSPTDSRLDPTRRPNGIMLINGEKLFRGGDTPAEVDSVEDVVKEKGLTLVSNLPVYIKGEFNKHTQQEFTDGSDTAFYDRSTLNESFACRLGDPRLPNCTGDDWRPATVLGDAVTILSGTFREGFRNEGDFDLRNNADGATFATSTIPTLPATQLRRNQGFYNNNFVTNGLSSGAFNASGVVDNSGTMTEANYLTIDGEGLNSSYFNNFVTPIQRRGDYPEYLMEVCTKLPVSACTENDWYVDPDATLKTDAITSDTTFAPATHKAGTTARPPAIELQRFPRRVAFKRTTADDLGGTPTNTNVTALGLDGDTIKEFDSSSAPPPQPNSLWFASATSSTPPLDFGNTQSLFFLNAVTALDPSSKFQFIDGDVAPATIISNLKQQPLLMPVLQIHATDSVPKDGVLEEGQIVEGTKWLLPTPATPSTQEFNLIVGSGDVPSRKIPGTTTGEFNGGLQNLPRFIENWRDGAVTTKIIGSFIQLNRSAYSNAPFLSRLANSLPRSAFCPTTVATCSLATGWYPDSYKTSNGGGSIPFFSPPGRNWGFDVGLLSQPPDLFTQRFTAPSTQTKPAEFFREVPRNDEWVQTLMCAFDNTGTTPIVSSDLRPTSFCQKIKADS